MEPGTFYVPGSPTLLKASYEALKLAKVHPSGLLKPGNYDASGGPNDPAWGGEGQYLFAKGDIPDANYIAGPSYLLNWGRRRRPSPRACGARPRAPIRLTRYPLWVSALRWACVTVRSIQHGVFFSPVTELPRGRHALDRETVAAAQRERLMAAFTELVAAHGLTAVTVGDVVARANVSRTAFYGSFEDLAACADATYERFIAVLLTRLTQAMDPTSHWHEFTSSAVRTYLETLQDDRVVARAMQLEMDAAGKGAECGGVSRSST